MKEKERLELDNSLRSLAASSFIVLIGVIISKIAIYFYRILIARNYGPETYGIFSLALMVSGLLTIFAGMGLSMGILRYVSIYRGKNEKSKIKFLYKKSIAILAFTGILSGLVLFFTSETLAINVFHSPELVLFLKLFSIAIPVTVLSSMFLSVIRAYEKINALSFITNILRSLSKLTVLVILILIGVGTFSVPLSYVFGSIAVLITSYFVVRKLIPSIAHKSIDDKKVLKEMFSYSWPLIFFGMAVSLFYWTDIFIIGIYMSVKEVGFYSVAAPLALLITLSNDLFRQLFFPLVTKEYSKGNKEAVKEISKQTTKWVAMVGMPIFILMITFPEQIISLSFGKDYLQAVPALRILAIGALSTSVLWISRELISMRGRSKLLLVDMLVAVFLNIILNLILVPRYGINGAAISTTITIVLLNLTYLFQAYKVVKIVPLKRKMLNLALAGIVMTLILFKIKALLTMSLNALLIVGAIFLLAYPLILIITNSLDKNDFIFFKIIKNKLEGTNKRSDISFK